MAKHKPGVIWPTRIGVAAASQIVSTESTNLLKISFFPGYGRDGLSVSISRRDARLLAKRINQCLDYTK